ncbi:hypothetical protein HMPREF9440_00274 [Sutterella parvirubra YIT 11816]|uniref:Uncharacterized protein n=1 Tax=Sutterella parvirubra YIT 11816 TaxID=762967 RepID=H3KC25_9BURK|nr:hypothetical protein HMPREF9440_00274 [Sutterella parvirubra YIT 11816]
MRSWSLPGVEAVGKMRRNFSDSTERPSFCLSGVCLRTGFPARIFPV